MKVNNGFVLTNIEAAYVIFALRIALDQTSNPLLEGDREMLDSIMINLSAAMGLQEELENIFISEKENNDD